MCVCLMYTIEAIAQLTAGVSARSVVTERDRSCVAQKARRIVSSLEGCITVYVSIKLLNLYRVRDDRKAQGVDWLGLGPHWG